MISEKPTKKQKDKMQAKMTKQNPPSREFWI